MIVLEWFWRTDNTAVTKHSKTQIMLHEVGCVQLSPVWLRWATWCIPVRSGYTWLNHLYRQLMSYPQLYNPFNLWQHVNLFWLICLLAVSTLCAHSELLYACLCTLYIPSRLLLLWYLHFELILAIFSSNVQWTLVDSLCYHYRYVCIPLDVNTSSCQWWCFTRVRQVKWPGW